jgi:NAD(P)-dependent dehydrogenase (short-subunit alcohol dehydrogenase family)
MKAEKLFNVSGQVAFVTGAASGLGLAMAEVLADGVQYRREQKRVKDLKAKTAIVTGAASGIGSGIAQTLAEAGMNVALLDIQERALDDVRRQIEARGGKAISTTIDVFDVQAMVASTDRARHRRIMSLDRIAELNMKTQR